MKRCAQISRNSRVLIVAIVLFATITVTQFAAAIAAHSNALLVDCASMLADTISYIFNLISECSRSEDERSRMRRGLISSFMSIIVLCAITTWGLADSIQILFVDSGAVPDTLEPYPVLIFGSLGIAVDLLTLAAFKVWGFQIDENQTAETESSSFVNMCSAFAHVLADCIRSITSVILGIVVIYDKSVNGSVCDAIATLVVAATIIVGIVPLVVKWVRTASDYFSLQNRRPRNSSTTGNNTPPSIQLPPLPPPKTDALSTLTVEAKEAPSAAAGTSETGSATSSSSSRSEIQSGQELV